ncbi:hypothetical protein [Hyphomicrobium sp.]|uniref:hypothetical protein n=1 Tax=Hyphomicrobium sp. TaxID=82 RepID=UPI001E08E5B6|nr:hypothetical protein [Hyphomicrobium sp.]MBY0559931.1 hypothetical protein [Hyphomicrobium sp.]
MTDAHLTPKHRDDVWMHKDGLGDERWKWDVDMVIVHSETYAWFRMFDEVIWRKFEDRTFPTFRGIRLIVTDSIRRPSPRASYTQHICLLVSARNSTTRQLRLGERPGADRIDTPEALFNLERDRPNL